jgi:hypothetical protein
MGAEGQNIPDAVMVQGRKVRIKGDKARIDDLPVDIREELGEIRESSFRATRGIEKGYRDVAAAKLFGTLRTLPGVVHPDMASAADDFETARAFWRTASAADKDVAREAMREAEKAMRAVEASPGYVKLPNTEGLGVLRGAVVRKDVADYVNGVPNMKGAFGRALSMWKVIHTVYNPGTHIGNFASNLTKYHMAGLPLHTQPEALRAASKSLRALDATCGSLRAWDSTELCNGSVIGLPAARARQAMRAGWPTKASTRQAFAEWALRHGAGETMRHGAARSSGLTDGRQRFAVAMFRGLGRAWHARPRDWADRTTSTGHTVKRGPGLRVVRDVHGHSAATVQEHRGPSDPLGARRDLGRDGPVQPAHGGRRR